MHRYFMVSSKKQLLYSYAASWVCKEDADGFPPFPSADGGNVPPGGRIAVTARPFRRGWGPSQVLGTELALKHGHGTQHAPYGPVALLVWGGCI